MSRFPLALVAIPLFSIAVHAAEVALPASFDVKAVDQWLEAQVGKAHRVGLSVVIVKDGKEVLAKGYGKRSLADGRAVGTDTMFAIGSVTKQFTCACVLLLAEEGKLSVHDPVAKFYPKLTRAQDITLLDLMNHVSGYPDYYPLDFVDRRMQKPIVEDDLLAQYAGGRLDFEPGSKYSYSNTGYILLGRVVEKVSKQAFEEFVSQRIFKPLGMEHTAYEPASPDPRLAQGYNTFMLSDAEAVGPEGRGWIGAAGGIFSTARDLTKWDLALMEGKVLKPESLALMTASRRLTDGRVSDYGCGLALRPQNGWPVWTHSGAVSGFNASNAMVPGTRSVVVMLANLEGGIGSLPSQVLSLMLKETPLVPKVKGAGVIQTVKEQFTAMQSGKVNRKHFSQEFNHFLTDDKLAAAGSRLTPFGKPTSAEIISTHERGGMEVSVTRLRFEHGSLRVLMYRQPSGTIEQYFVSED